MSQSEGTANSVKACSQVLKNSQTKLPEQLAYIRFMQQAFPRSLYSIGVVHALLSVPARRKGSDGSQLDGTQAGRLTSRAD